MYLIDLLAVVVNDYSDEVKRMMRQRSSEALMEGSSLLHDNAAVVVDSTYSCSDRWCLSHEVHACVAAAVAVDVEDAYEHTAVVVVVVDAVVVVVAVDTVPPA